MAQAPAERVVVVGGGFGGLALVRELTRRRRPAPVHVTLVDRRNHHTFQPLLYQVATAVLQPQDIGISFRAILRRRVRWDVRLGEVTGIDPDSRVVKLADGATLGYDRLALAAGAITEDLGIPGVAEHAFGLKSLADAVALRNHVLRCFEVASADPDHPDDGSLTFVIAGGGPTGVELAGALAELVGLVIRRDHPDIDVSRVRILLVELVDQLLPGYSPQAGRTARRGLSRRGVEVRLGTGIENVTAHQVELSDGAVLPARTVVWAAGVSASPLADTLGVDLAKGRRIPVDDHLRVRGLDNVYAIGDLAAAVDESGEPLPQLAPVAIQQGRYLGRRLAAGEQGTAAPFRYRDRGSMATIGRAAAVVDLPGGLHLRGFVAWVAWLVLHLFQLVGFKNRGSVLASWVWNYLAYDHAARVIVDQREAETAETARGGVRRSWADEPPVG